MTAFVLGVFTIVYLGMAAGRLSGLLADRTRVALLGAIALVLAGALDRPAVLGAIDFPTLIVLFVLFVLMVLSAQYAACGFDAWCAARLAAVPVSPLGLLALVTAVGGGLSAVLANDVVVFAMTPMLVIGLARAGVAKAVAAKLALLALFATPLPHTEGLLIVAGALLISRRLATRRLLGLVDWQLLVLFAGLFVATAALTATGLPAILLERMAELGWHLDSLEVLAPLVVIGSNSIGNVPLVVVLLGIVPHPSPETLYALALLSTLAGNLLLTGSLANIIAVERAAEVGLEIGFAEHARIGVPITVLSLGLALSWLGHGSG